jgi:hypothetical protein
MEFAAPSSFSVDAIPLALFQDQGFNEVGE